MHRVLRAGEGTKNLRTVLSCYDWLARNRFERDSFLIALGGGVVGDVAGFVAATYLRGLPFVQVPTTLLAQVDSSVGGKVGVNLKAGKNLVGAFHQPRIVLADLSTLKTLPDREFRAGLAEVIKYGIIHDADLFARLERDVSRMLRRDRRVLMDVAARCCEIKAEVVRQDERESGRRAILNFGHTIGHALEALGGYSRYLHGEAIAIGQAAAARISARQLGLPADQVRRVYRLLERAGLPVRVSLTAGQCRRVLRLMRLDKKARGGELRFVLVKRIGEAVWGQRVPEEVVIESLRKLATAGA